MWVALFELTVNLKYLDSIKGDRSLSHMSKVLTRLNLCSVELVGSCVKMDLF